MILLRPRGPRRSWAALLGGRADPLSRPVRPFLQGHVNGPGGGSPKFFKTRFKDRSGNRHQN